MIETIKKYVKDSSQIKLAEEIIRQFEEKKKKTKTPNLKLQASDVSNFGIVPKLHMDFDKDVTFFMGESKSGKSWAMESWLHLLTGSSRATKEVVGEFDDKFTGVLKFNGLVSEWSRSGSSGQVKVKKGEETICKGPRDLSKAIEKQIGIDPELLTSTLYYSPRMSFQFSRRLPFEREELLIRIAKGEAWIDLEKFAKQLKEDESDKLSEVSGTIGYIAEMDYTKGELQKLIEKNNGEIKDIEKQIKELKIPDVTKLNNEYNKLREKVDERNGFNAKIKQYQGQEEFLAIRTSELKEYQEMLSDLSFDEKTMIQIKENIDKLKEKLNQVKSDGLKIMDEIEKNKLMTENAECPVLKIDCDKLKESNTKIEKEIVELGDKRKVLADEYRNVQKETKKLEEDYNTQSIKKEKAVEINLKCKNQEGHIASIKVEIESTDIKKFQQTVEKFDPNLDNEFEKIDERIKNINQEIEQKNKERDEFFDTKTELLADIKDYQQKLDDMVKMEKFIKEKNRLEKRQKLFDELLIHFNKKGIPKSEAKRILPDLNKYMNLIIGLVSNKTISLKINEAFEMAVKCASVKKEITPKTVSLGEEEVINMSFVGALGLVTFKGKLPYFFTDDFLAFQSDKTGKEVVTGLVELQKQGYIQKLYICSNRLHSLKLNNLADKIFTFDNGKYKMKKMEVDKG